MSSSFVHAPRSESGYDVATWLRNNWDGAKFDGDDLIATHDGSRHPVKDCAVVFRNFRPVTGTPGAYFADPVAVVQYRSAMLTSIDGTLKYDHPVVRKEDVLVPLGTPKWRCPNARIVLQQSARHWVSGGRNTADMSDTHIIALYYAALQQLVFHGGNATTAEEQQVWFPALVALTRAFSTIHASYEDARSVTEALVLTPGANDMIQKGLAYVFHSEEEWSVEARLDMLTIALRRNLRYGRSSLGGMAPGPFVLFVLVPLLRNVAHPYGTVLPESATLLERFNAAATDLLHLFATDMLAHSSTDALNARVLVSLTAAMGAPLTAAMASALLTHIATTDSSAEPDWAAIGALPAKPRFAAEVDTERYAIGGRKGATFRARLTPTSERTLNAYSYKGVEWTALGFKAPGIYTVTAHSLGIATRGIGNTHSRELNANWRLTAGYDILPHTRGGYSLAGEAHVRTPYGTWQYKRSAPLLLSEPFVVIVKPTSVELVQRHQVFIMEKTAREPALLGFKNMWLSVHYAALPVVLPPPTPAVTAPPRTPTPVSSGASWSSIARVDPPGAPARIRIGAPTHEERVSATPPTALIAHLRTLTVP